MIEFQYLRGNVIDDNKSQATWFFNACVNILLIVFFTIPSAHAESTYLGILYGQANMDGVFIRDFDTFGAEVGDTSSNNVGFVIGRSRPKGFGYEFFYAPTTKEGSTSVDLSFFGRSGGSTDVTIDAYGLLGYYKTSHDDFGAYLKLKGGYAVVDLEFDFENFGRFDDDTSGLAYGFSFGVNLGNSEIEATYLVLPGFKDFDGFENDREIKIDMLDISYRWHFD